MEKCPLCLESSAALYCERTFRWGHRRWMSCDCCDLVFVHPQDRPSSELELTEYQLHQNSSTDLRYVAQLERLVAPLEKFLERGTRGLDYGSGPNPVLSEILTEKGIRVSIYDPFFASDESVFDTIYRLITCTEVAEHFFNPRFEFDRIVSRLESGGILGITTSPRDPSANFLEWPYIREKSHVSLYSLRTMEWLCKHYGLALRYYLNSVWIFCKSID